MSVDEEVTAGKHWLECFFTLHPPPHPLPASYGAEPVAKGYNRYRISSAIFFSVELRRYEVLLRCEITFFAATPPLDCFFFFFASSRWEIQFKGAGLTPYSRTADGRKVKKRRFKDDLALPNLVFLFCAVFLLPFFSLFYL